MVVLKDKGLILRRAQDDKAFDSHSIAMYNILYMHLLRRIENESNNI